MLGTDDSRRRATIEARLEQALRRAHATSFLTSTLTGTEGERAWTLTWPVDQTAVDMAARFDGVVLRCSNVARHARHGPRAGGHAQRAARRRGGALSATPPGTRADLVHHGLGSRRYIWGVGLAYSVDSAGAIEVYHTDGFGSVRALTDGSGSVVQTYETDEFGMPLDAGPPGSKTQPFGYPEEVRDPPRGLSVLLAQEYDPQIEWSLQRDPFGGLAGVTCPGVRSNATLARRWWVTHGASPGRQRRLWPRWPGR
ncbi:MAG: hypothetical protein HY332_14870 [Chloroflexi bacterium]|nr:hypothetical protein [Chloroflexota bacterium]